MTYECWVKMIEIKKYGALDELSSGASNFSIMLHYNPRPASTAQEFTQEQ